MRFLSLLCLLVLAAAPLVTSQGELRLLVEDLKEQIAFGKVIGDNFVRESKEVKKLDSEAVNLSEFKATADEYLLLLTAAINELTVVQQAVQATLQDL